MQINTATESYVLASCDYSALICIQIFAHTQGDIPAVRDLGSATSLSSHTLVSVHRLEVSIKLMLSRSYDDMVRNHAVQHLNMSRGI